MERFHFQLNEKLEKDAATETRADDSMLDEMQNFRALHVGGDNGSDPSWHRR